MGAGRRTKKPGAPSFHQRAGIDIPQADRAAANREAILRFFIGAFQPLAGVLQRLVYSFTTLNAARFSALAASTKYIPACQPETSSSVSRESCAL